MNRVASSLCLLFAVAVAVPAVFADGEAKMAAPEVAPPSVGPLTRELFLASVSREIATHFNLEGDLQLELSRPWTRPPQVAARWDVTVTEFPSVASSAMMVRCRIQADGQVAAEPTLVLRASLWREAWATRMPLTAQARFDPGQLETRRVDLFRDREALPAAVGDRTFIFARAVPAGRLLTWHDIARRPLVRRGELVDVSAVDGALTVTMKALAMETGAQGDRITIRNLDSRRDFTALVIDENRVQVRF